MAKRISALTLLALLFACVAFAQVDGRQVVVSPDGLREAEVAGSTNDALKVICVDGTCTGGAGGTQDVNIVEVGGNPVTTTVPVECVTGCATTGPQTITDTLNVNGDTIVLELNGAAGASALFPNANDLVGTVVFEVSNDGGTEYNEVTAVAWPTGDISNPALADVAPSNYLWQFTLAGGETHVRVRVTAYTSGSASVTLTGTAVPSNPLQAAEFAGAGGARPGSALLVGGRSGTEARPVTVRGDADGAADQGFVVWDMATSHRVGGAMTGARDFGTGIGGRDASDLFVFGELRDTAPASDVNGLVVRGVGNFTVVQPTGTNLHVVCDSGCGGAATFADDSAFTFGTTAINITGFVFDDVAPNAVTENNAAAPRMSGNRVPYSILRDAAGNERGANVTAGNALVVDGSASTQPVSAVDLDIRNLTFPTDKVDASGSTVHQGVGTLTIGDSWFIKISDGVDGPADVAALNEALSPTSFAVLARAHITDAGGTAADVTAANALKVDGSAVTQPISGTVTVTDGAGALNVIVDSGTLTAVTAITNALPAGNNNIGDVDVVSFPDNEPFNLAQVNGQTVNVGAGASGTGTARVAVAIDPVTGNAPAAATVGVASASCLASNANRKAAFFKNTSNNTISIAESGQTAVLNSGITLQPGDAYNMIPPFLTTGQVNCIASAASSNLSILEKQ